MTLTEFWKVPGGKPTHAIMSVVYSVPASIDAIQQDITKFKIIIHNKDPYIEIVVTGATKNAIECYEAMKEYMLNL